MTSIVGDPMCDHRTRDWSMGLTSAPLHDGVARRAIGHATTRRPRSHTIVQWIASTLSAVIEVGKMKAMNSLVQLTLDAHGGLERWRQFEHVSAHLLNKGVLWSLKHQQDVIEDVDVRIALRREWVSHSPFGEPTWRTSFEPHRVAIETTDGRIIEERLAPRDSFAGHRLDTPWDRMHLAYFAGYAVWTYLSTPFVFTMDSVVTQELEPGTRMASSGDAWKRPSLLISATHGMVQTFYFGSDGLLRRHDYDAEVLGGSPVAHYVHDYREFSGLLVPTKTQSAWTAT